MADLPARLGEHDRARVRFVAQLSGVDAELGCLLTRDLPFTAVNVVACERRSPCARWVDETKRHLDQLLPTGEARPSVAYWLDTEGQVVVTVGACVEGWLGVDAPEWAVIESGWTFRLGQGQGPLTVAVRIWQRWFDDLLRPPALSQVAVPHTIDESCALLAEHSRARQRCRSHLCSLMRLSGPDGAALIEAASQRIQFVITDHQLASERDRGVWFRDCAEIAAGEEVLIVASPDAEVWTGWGSVDSFVTTDAEQSAAGDLKRIINAMVGRMWL